ncbi:DUF6777 domain-containing protein [Actinomyces sp.]|uniref:DUF6777 domain-containing protein n=1 Tax=Actinomyces sp. TaxID=29317 RepID=UPI00289EE014|nr:DUF6777 domain-containing protein [Actinomyces sp.]
MDDPPPTAAPVPSSAPTRRSRRLPALIAAALALLLVVGGVVFWNQGRSSEAVELEPAAAAGPAPFVDAAAESAPATFSSTLRAGVEERSAALTADATTGVRSTGGDTEGLYAHSPTSTVCDAAALAARLGADTATASAWARARGVPVDQIGEHLAGLFPVYLTVDTLVTNHRFERNGAVAFTALLQAGTAVLVDARGLPAVRCACGNPLLPPATGTVVRGATFRGTAWDGFDADAVHAVSAAPGPMGSLSALHVDTAAVVELAAGGIEGETDPLLLVTVEDATVRDGIMEPATTGSIHVSEDGATWEKVLDTGPLSDVDASEGLAVAVGHTDSGGIIHTSTDGRTWSDPVEVIDPLVDVAHGDGVWVAVGDRSFAEEGGAGDGSAGAVYLSEDGVSWERVATTDPYGNSRLASSGEVMGQMVRSVGYGDGLWVMTATECAYRICELVEFTSEDARTWTRHHLDSEILDMDVHHDGRTWGFVGSERDPTGIEENMAEKDRPLGLAGTSVDGTTWQTGATRPDRPHLTGLSAGPDGWYAVDTPTYGSRGSAPSRGEVHHSDNLETWTLLGTVAEGISGIAVLTGQDPSTASTPAPGPSATSSARSTPQAVGVLIHTAGISVDDGSADAPVIPYEGPASAAVEALTQALGEPVAAFDEGDGYCSGPTTALSWNGLTIRHEGTDASGTWWLGLAGGAGDLPTLPVATPEGVTLGMAVAEVAQRAPGATTESWAHEGVTWERFLLDITPDGEKGTEVMAEGGTVRSIAAPVWVMGDC